MLVAVARGDLSQKMALEIEGQPVKGEFLRIGTTVNQMVDQLSAFSTEVSRVAKEVGTDGKLGGQARVERVSGTWKNLTENVNFMAGNLTAQVRDIAQVATAVANGDLSQKISVDAKGEVAALADTINTMVDQLSSFADEVTRVRARARSRPVRRASARASGSRSRVAREPTRSRYPRGRRGDAPGQARRGLSPRALRHRDAPTRGHAVAHRERPAPGDRARGVSRLLPAQGADLRR